MKSGEPGWGKHPGTLTCRVPAGARASGYSMLLLPLLGLLGMPVARGDCGPPPPMTYSRPSVDKHTISFPIGSSVMYTCIEGTIKIPGRSDMVKCLPGARWSTLPEPCGRKYLLSLRPSSKEPLAWLHASAPYCGCSTVASPPLARYRPTSHGCCLLMGAGSLLVSDGVSWMVAGAHDAPAPPKPWVSEAAEAATPYFLLTALPAPLSHLHPCFAKGHAAE
ncbi:uncharacterized protein LOC130594672 [Pezoporus wallicus]|uniref:uncharacterized protein LOC130594672 n=1 Tax=Pezoporus wallicus TaxID=35540 RepID=UPI00254C67FA|nr:uncharacterized protein LOC130594672 [Pezoporus wallicus]